MRRISSLKGTVFPLFVESGDRAYTTGCHIVAHLLTLRDSSTNRWRRQTDCLIRSERLQKCFKSSDSIDTIY